MDAGATSRDDVRRVLIAGDTHGNTAWVESLTKRAAQQGCPIIIQVGDFGYFPDRPGGQRFLTDVDSACAVNGVELWFIDGNHDDHFALADHRERDTPVALTDHVTYIPRGARCALGGRGFGFLGGAFSVDWRDRTHGLDWWPNERTDDSDVARLGGGQLDVLIAHDAPAGVALSARRLPAEDQVRTDDVRSLIATAVEATRPQVVFHGHWHHAHETELSWIDRVTTEQTGALTWRSTRVIGLGYDSDAIGGWLVLQLDTLEVRWPTNAIAEPIPPGTPRFGVEVES
jgi:predicted phosphodiesterase